MYKVVIGLEVHCELKTNSKNFSSAANDYSSLPNVNVEPVDLGFPGILPVVNKEAVKRAIKMALAFNCDIPEILIFDRKNYFYPDLPKGYQITQLTKPIGTNGYVMINVNGIDKKILIRDTHLEEDTASLDHYTKYSLIDYNRCGVPLLETVTEPCMNSVEEAMAFLETLRGMFLYCGTSEARLDRGQIRCDVNINLKDDNDNYITPRVEVKNVNSFNNVKNTILYEIKRQTEAYEKGIKIDQETRRYDENDMCTYTMRKKEDAIDYKYFIEPNIAPIKIDREWIEEIRKEIPIMQHERLKKYIEEYELSLHDASILVKDINVANYFEKCVNINIEPKISANWITTKILEYVNKNNIEINNILFKPNMLKELTDMLKNKEISSKQAKEVFDKSVEEGKHPKIIVEELCISQNSNSDELKNIVIDILNTNPDNVEKYKNGRTNLMDFFVGQVMKMTRGTANPSMATEIIKEELEKR